MNGCPNTVSQSNSHSQQIRSLVSNARLCRHRYKIYQTRAQIEKKGNVPEISPFVQGSNPLRLDPATSFLLFDSAKPLFSKIEKNNS